MFGFGRPAREKAVINQISAQLQAVGIAPDAAKTAATNSVDEVLAAFKERGIDPFRENQGDLYAADNEFAGPRLAAGLTIEDIRYHWNRPLLYVGVEEKVRQLVNFIAVDVVRQQGGDVKAASDRFKKTSIRYGDPTNFNLNDKYNEGLRAEDADLYVEFARRVDAWRGRQSDAQVAQFIERNGTLNAAVRAMVRNKVI